MSWTRLIRFTDDAGRESFGEPEVDSAEQVPELLAQGQLYATEYQGASPVAPLTKGSRVHVKEVLNLLRPSDVPIIRCIGLNYIKHSA